MSERIDCIISKLNKEIVTFSSYDFITKRLQCKSMTLKNRLKTTCEESFLVSGEWLASNQEKFDTDSLEIENDRIYCVGTECVYDLGSYYEEAHHLLLEDGYVSQLSNTQFCEEWETDYWETTAGKHRFTKFDEETFVFS
ncbi:hypothetical protein AB9M75_10790 [Lactobacillus sp. AN1001]